MNHIVNLTEQLLERGRTLQGLGRTQDALHTLTRLAGFRELTPQTAEETQARLADLHLQRRRFRSARRHGSAALSHRPDHAPHHQRMGRACQANGSGDLRRALDYYRRALELEPDDTASLVEAGLLAVQLGRTDDGLTWLRRALELAPENADVVGKAVRGLCQAGQADEARSTLRAALFRNPRQPRFRKLYNDFQFQQLRRTQELERLEREVPLQGEEPVLLPFLRCMTEHSVESGSPRHDGPATLPGPHRRRRQEMTPIDEQTGCEDINA